MKFTKRITTLLLLLCLLLSVCPAAFAEQAPQTEFDDSWFEGLTWEETMDRFIEEYGINSESVGIGYLNLVTGEEHYINPDLYIVAASMYKIPINMLFTAMVDNGEIDWDTNIRGYRYSYLLEGTVINSNNDLAEIMWNYLGGYHTYREKIAPIMGEDPENVDKMFYKNNYFTSRQMIYCLNELYTNQNHYPKLIDTLLRAEPTKYFRAHTHDVEIAHKYGYLDENGHFYLNDCGFVFTEDPIALVIFTDNTHDPYKVLADYCDLMIAYTDYHRVERIAREEAEAMAAAIAELEAKAQPAAADNAPTPAETEGAENAEPAEVTLKLPVFTPAAPENSGKGGAAMITAYVFTGLFLVLALIYLIIRAARSKINLPLAIGSVITAALAMAICVYAVNVTPVVKDAEGNPQESIEAFFSALERGNYEEAYSYVSGFSTLGIENEPSGDAAKLVYELLRDSFSYKFYGDCAKSGTSAAQGLLFTYLDLNALKTDLQKRTELEVEKLVDELDIDEIYGEDEEYLDSFLNLAYVNSLNDLLTTPEKYYKTSGLVIYLEYKDDMWKIVPDPEFNAALSGNTSY